MPASLMCSHPSILVAILGQVSTIIRQIALCNNRTVAPFIQPPLSARLTTDSTLPLRPYEPGETTARHSKLRPP
jgi:hypothetical protein